MASFKTNFLFGWARFIYLFYSILLLVNEFELIFSHHFHESSIHMLSGKIICCLIQQKLGLCWGQNNPNYDQFFFKN